MGYWLGGSLLHGPGSAKRKNYLKNRPLRRRGGARGDIMWENDIENKNYKAVMVWGIDDGDSVAFIKPLTEWYG